jgi:hypothetical protein
MIFVTSAACAALVLSCAETSHSSLVGGNSISLKKIVDMFYDKVLADGDLFPFFENIDMSKLKKHQVRQEQLRNPVVLGDAGTKGMALWCPSKHPWR